MPTITMSDATYRALSGIAESGRLTDPQRRPDGRWRCNVSDEVFAILVDKQLVGETLDQTLTRLAEYWQSGD